VPDASPNHADLNRPARPDDRPTTRLPISRRQVLAGIGAVSGLAAAGAIAPRSALASALAGSARPASRTPQTPWITGAAGTAPRHLAWVWQFRHDGDPEILRATLAAHGLGIILKTHDGTSWMSRYDPTPNTVDGPAAVEGWARFFEDGGVPFHAWALVKGRNPQREAEMAAEVLAAGARSLFVDLEAHAGFWEGTTEDAELYGQVLRQRQPNGRVSTSIDARPWEIDRIPLREFAAFTDEISPQLYWGAFADSANARRYAELSGGPVTPEQITPSFVVETSMARLTDFGLPIHPIGDGTVPDTDNWSEFIDRSYTTVNSDVVSVWRYGVTSSDVLALLRDTPPRVTAYVVEPGDTLSAIAARFRTTVPALVRTNGITNANMIGVGTRLVLPNGSQVSASSGAVSAPAARGAVHVVQPGDSLLGIAYRYDRSADAIARANGITNHHLIRIGQQLVIP
jgi:LysM repeat protein